ncbi:MAG TPA: alpha/beta hydrolase [Xanthobacteraceae bacterium]|nr:alpha/beta hydrolase [Xanthobacteraceae bacterium]
MVTPSVKTIPLKHCNFEAKIKTAGSGPPLLYLHAAGGPIWDPFVEGLCERFTVYAPHHPGTGATARDSIYAVENLWDLLIIYEEMLDALGLQSVPVIGTSFGGMMAFELAAHQPRRISKIVALDPIGLWRDDAPVAPYMLLPPEKLVAVLYKHLDSPPVQAALAMPSDPKEVAVITADLVWALGATGKFVWPIPDKGLKKRLHRVKAPALIVWGEDDQLVSSVYAKEFADRLAQARVEIVKDCGHVPQVERLDVVGPMVAKFLDGG